MPDQKRYDYTIKDYEHMMDEMRDNGTKRGYFFPAEKQRIKAIAKLIEVEMQKQKQKEANIQQNK